MEGYGYPYPPAYPPARKDGAYPDHGDGFGDYYPMAPVNDDISKRSMYDWGWHYGYWENVGEPWGLNPYWQRTPQYMPTDYKFMQRPSCSKRQSHHHKRSRSRDSATKSRSSRSRSKSGSRSRSKSKSRSRSRSHTRSRSHSDQRELLYKEPTLLDSFRVLYLTPSKHKKSTTKYLSTKKKQDKVHELLKSDRLGSKRWYFYPRVHASSEPITGDVAGTRDNSDQRIKVDGDFFRKYKKRKKIDLDAPIAKLKRWELVLYKKLGFLQAV